MTTISMDNSPSSKVERWLYRYGFSSLDPQKMATKTVVLNEVNQATMATSLIADDNSTAQMITNDSVSISSGTKARLQQAFDLRKTHSLLYNTNRKEITRPSNADNWCLEVHRQLWFDCIGEYCGFERPMLLTDLIKAGNKGLKHLYPYLGPNWHQSMLHKFTLESFRRRGGKWSRRGKLRLRESKTNTDNWNRRCEKVPMFISPEILEHLPLESKRRIEYYERLRRIWSEIPRQMDPHARKKKKRKSYCMEEVNNLEKFTKIVDTATNRFRNTLKKISKEVFYDMGEYIRQNYTRLECEQIDKERKEALAVQKEKIPRVRHANIPIAPLRSWTPAWISHQNELCISHKIKLEAQSLEFIDPMMDDPPEVIDLRVDESAQVHDLTMTSVDSGVESFNVEEAAIAAVQTLLLDLMEIESHNNNEMGVDQEDSNGLDITMESEMVIPEYEVMELDNEDCEFTSFIGDETDIFDFDGMDVDDGDSIFLTSPMDAQMNSRGFEGMDCEW